MIGNENKPGTMEKYFWKVIPVSLLLMVFWEVILIVLLLFPEKTIYWSRLNIFCLILVIVTTVYLLSWFLAVYKYYNKPKKSLAIKCENVGEYYLGTDRLSKEELWKKAGTTEPLTRKDLGIEKPETEEDGLQSYR